MPYRLVTLARQAGPVGIWAGLGPRMVMTAGLVAGQFLIYGAIKEGMSSIILILPAFAAVVLIPFGLAISAWCTARDRDSQGEQGEVIRIHLGQYWGYILERLCFGNFHLSFTKSHCLVL
jgi:hypothetical protein